MRWLAISRTTLLVLITVQAGAAQAAGDATRGADIFRQNCAMCHSPEPGQNLVGPSLFSVVGRAAASIASFPYSSPMKRRAPGRTARPATDPPGYGPAPG